MTEIRIEPARAVHVGPVANNLSAEEDARTHRMGLRPRAALRRLVANSPYRRVILADGKPVAIWGVAGSLLASEAELWLVATPAARRIGRRLARLVRPEVDDLAARHPRLRVTMAAEDAAALRFARFAGARMVGAHTVGTVALVDGLIEREG